MFVKDIWWQILNNLTTAVLGFVEQVGITVITSMDVYNLKSDREYLFRVTPRNKYGWGESTVSAHPVRTILRTGLPQLHQQLHPQIKALVNTDIQLVCEVKGHLMIIIMIIIKFKKLQRN